MPEVAQLLSGRALPRQAGARGAELPGWAERAGKVAQTRAWSLLKHGARWVGKYCLI